MRKKLLIIVAAVLLGAVAAFAAGRYLAGARAKLEADAEPVEVLVAKSDAPKGMSLDEMKRRGIVETRSLPKRYVASGAISSPRRVEDRVLAVPVTAGEQLTESKFQFPSDAGLSCAVPEGYLAVSVAVDAERGVADLVKPGDHVAVLVTLYTSDEEKANTKILLPKARVLAVGKKVGAEPEDAGHGEERRAVLGEGPKDSGDAAAGTVTMALKAVDAERLVLAEEMGKVWLALLPSTSGAAPSPSGQTMLTVLR